MTTLQQRFLAAEQQFLPASAAGEEALLAFNSNWTGLLTDLSIAVELCQIDPETMSLAHTVASRVGILANTLMSLDLEGQKACEALKTRCADVLSHVDDSSSPPLDHSPQFPPHSIPSLSSSSFKPERCEVEVLDRAACLWLLQNLDNPYPSSVTKTLMARRCGSTVEEVQAWFRTARQHIGWTALLQNKFSGSRRAVCDAASRSYLTEHADIPSDVRRAFVAIKVLAERMYSHYDAPSDARHSSDEDGLTEPGSVARPTLVASGIKYHTPSPSPFPPLSTVQSSTDPTGSEEDEDTSPPPLIAGSKRRLDVSIGSSVEGSDSFFASWTDESRPTKRRKNESIDPQVLEYFSEDISAENTQSCYRAMQSQSNMTVARIFGDDGSLVFCQRPPIGNAYGPVDDGHGLSDSLALSSPPGKVILASVRKRSLSDAGLERPLKQARGLTDGHRKQAVSGPLPRTLDLNTPELLGTDNWLQTSFDTHQLSDTNTTDPSATFDVEADGFTAFSEDASPSFIDPISPVSELDVPNSDLESATTTGFDFSAFDLSEYMTETMSYSDFSISPTPSGGTSTSTSPSVGSLPDVSDHGLADGVDQSSYEDWGYDDSQFAAFLKSSDSLPALSQSFWSGCSSISQAAPSSSSPNDITHTLFDVNPFPPSDLLPEIGDLSSFPMSLGIAL